MTPRELDWPVTAGATAVLGQGRVELAYRPGTGPATRFPVASLTKPMTALATVAAVEAGRLGLDDEVAATQPGVTVRHLLAHASGLPMEEPGRRRPPGTRRVYSNVGFRLLGRVVEAAVGLPLEVWMRQTVFAPLDMRDSFLGERAGVPADPASGVVTTLEDLVRLADCLLAGGPPVVAPELLAEAVRVQFPGLAGLVPGVGFFDPCDWGLGLELHDAKEPHWMGAKCSPATFGHFGATGCFLWVDPAARIAAVAVTDRSFDDGPWAMQTWPAWSDRAAEGL